MSLWLTGMAYSALCIGIPEIRGHWKGSGKKIGLVGSIEFALFFWGPALTLLSIEVGLIHKQYNFAGYILCVLGVIIAVLGFLMDISDSSNQD